MVLNEKTGYDSLPSIAWVCRETLYVLPSVLGVCVRGRGRMQAFLWFVYWAHICKEICQQWMNRTASAVFPNTYTFAYLSRRRAMSDTVGVSPDCFLEEDHWNCVGEGVGG